MTRTPVHFDLAAAERRIRENFAAFHAMDIPDDTTEEAREFIDLQKDLVEVNIQASLWTMRARNSGAGVETATAALGQVVGSMIWEFASNTGHDKAEIINAVFDYAANAIDDLDDRERGGQGHDDTVVTTETISPVVGGRA